MQILLSIRAENAILGALGWGRKFARLMFFRVTSHSISAVFGPENMFTGRDAIVERLYDLLAHGQEIAWINGDDHHQVKIQGI